jgi:hypothetical protein
MSIRQCGQKREESGMQKKRWADLSAVQRTGVIVGATIQFGLLVAGLWDVAHRQDDEVRGDRRFWRGFMFVNWIGPIAYFAYGRKQPIWRSCGCGAEDQVSIEETGQVGGVPAV